MNLGPSRELFELWAPDSRNGVIITGYSIEGTLARVSLILIYLRDVITYSMYILFFFQWQHFIPLPRPWARKTQSSWCLGDYQWTWRIHINERDNNSKEDICWNSFIQCSRWLFAKFGIHRRSRRSACSEFRYPAHFGNDRWTSL